MTPSLRSRRSNRAEYSDEHFASIWLLTEHCSHQENDACLYTLQQSTTLLNIRWTTKMVRFLTLLEQYAAGST